MALVGSPPTRDIGHIDLDVLLGGGYVQDLQEQVPELMWPLSVQTYAKMRRDTHLAAVLKAYTLPIRRATWAVDPAGCRSEVVQHVADDLGLPILGTDKPGAARRRGVRWDDHLRLALLSLPFGFMPFERRYEIRDGRAHLVSLGERMPWTIVEIPLNADGTIQSAIQDVAGTQPMGADRLLWYAHEREGSAWTGTSVLRPAYTPWLLKHEMWRVHSTSIRRFGMGIPSVEAPPGATPAQVMEAQRLASAMRVGETAGAGLPNGFRLQLTGMTGSVPDALAWIRYLDQQMSTMALAGLLDLGQTATGSRALGDSFLDLFLLSLQAVADEVASVATSGQQGMTGAVTNIVDLNWGPDEPAPRIVCTDLGDSHELTAEAVGQLIQLGALTADEELEAFLRKRYELPAKPEPKEPPAPPAPPPVPPAEPPAAPPAGDGQQQPAGGDQNPAPAPPQAARPRKPRRRQTVRSAGPDVGHRQLTTVEAASGMDPDGLDNDWQTALTALLASWATISHAQRLALADQIEAAVDSGDLESLAGLGVDSEDAALALAAALSGLADDAAERMRSEADSQGHTIPAAQVSVDYDRLTQSARAVARIMAATTANAAGREAVRRVTPDAKGKAVADDVTSYLGDLGEDWLREQLGGALSMAQNAGRLAVLEAAAGSAGSPGAQLYASEVLDKNTCDPCRAIDGTHLTLADANARYGSGGYVDCLGRLRCRGTVIAVWAD